MKAFESMLAPVFGKTDPDTTEENIQARARGLIIMAISNKRGFMPLTTGNKSEMSVGYSTLYGDMCGGYSVLKDVYKTTVFSVSNWRNKNFVAGFMGPRGFAIPDRIINKRPSAELKPDQFDDDSLPPYDVLDDILIGLIEGESAVDDIVNNGHVLCIIEAMKVMNEVQSDNGGEIVEILVEDSVSVEYGQPLFKIRK